MIRQHVTVVQVRTGCELRDCRTGEVIVSAVPSDSQQKVEWRTTERPQIGDRFVVTIEPAPMAVA